MSALSHNHPGYVIVHCIRALGNFAKHELHVNMLVSSNFKLLSVTDVVQRVLDRLVGQTLGTLVHIQMVTISVWSQFLKPVAHDL